MTVRGCAFQALHKHGVGGAKAGCLGFAFMAGRKADHGSRDNSTDESGAQYQNFNMDFQP